MAEARSISPDDETLADAVRVALPLNRYETPEVVGTSGTVPPEGRVETVIVPADATDSGELIVGLEASLAAGMTGALDYLEHYAYECNEQTVSRFLPNLLTMRALRTLGVDDPALADQLAFQLGVGVQRLVSRQNPDGGWGYWPGEDSSPFITTYVLWGLLATRRRAGLHRSPASSLEAPIAYLERSVPGPVGRDQRLAAQRDGLHPLRTLGTGRGRSGPRQHALRRARADGALRPSLSGHGPGQHATRAKKIRPTSCWTIWRGRSDQRHRGHRGHEAAVDNWTLNTDTTHHGHRSGHVRPSCVRSSRSCRRPCAG